MLQNVPKYIYKWWYEITFIYAEANWKAPESCQSTIKLDKTGEL